MMMGLRIDAGLSLSRLADIRGQALQIEPALISDGLLSHEGDRLRATAREVSLTGRSGIYDVVVSNQNGKTLCEFRGISRAIAGTHFDEGGEA